MLKKLLYIGLGISIIAVKKSVSYLLEKRDQIDEQFAADATDDEAVTGDASEVEVVVSLSEEGVTVSEADDLTEINGIGPTYAKRLKEAGISTFAALSEQSPEELRLITKATGKSADPEAWIAQAGSLT